MADIDHDYTDEIVCPHCGAEHGDSWETSKNEDGALGIMACQRCGKPFTKAEAEVERLRGLSEFAPPGHPLHSCGGPQEACMQPGCPECGMPTMVEALAMRAEVGRLNQQIKDERAAMWSHLMDLLRLIDPDADPHYEEAYADLHAGIVAMRERAVKAEAELAATRKAKQENDERFMVERDEARARHAQAVALLRECSSILHYMGGAVIWARDSKALIANIDAHLAACDGKGVGG